jgi:hypothetical protein
MERLRVAKCCGRIVGLESKRKIDRVSRVEMPVGYSPWHCSVGRRKTGGHVVGMCCDKEADVRGRE